MNIYTPNPRLLSKTVRPNPHTLVTWHVTYNADNKRAQSPSRRRGATAILRRVRGLTSARARSGIPRRSGNCYRPIIFSNDTTVVSMAYDYMGRRFEYKETVNNTLTRYERYLYQGYLQIAALDMLNSTSLKHTIVWDPAERVATRPMALQIGTSAYYYSFDQVKNVTELLDSTGGLAATYDYSPFGQINSFQITQSGNIALTQFSNPLTLSSEVFDFTLGLQYYNYRHLNVLDGRWVNRDPKGEFLEKNLHIFCLNNAIVNSDVRGLLATPPVQYSKEMGLCKQCSAIESNYMSYIDDAMKQKLLNAMKNCKLKFPRIKCGECSDEDASAYYAGWEPPPKIILCGGQKKKRCEYDWWMILNHELQHAVDRACDGKGGCDFQSAPFVPSEGLKRLICTELRAYSNYKYHDGDVYDAVAASVYSSCKDINPVLKLAQNGPGEIEFLENVIEYAKKIAKDCLASN